MQRKSFMTSLVLAVVCIVLPSYGKMRVAIRDQNLGGLEAESVWAAAKELNTPLLEVIITQEMTCPELFVGKERPYRIDTPENRQKLLIAAKKNGCEIIAFCASVRLNKDNTSNLVWIEKVAKAASEMKVPVIMMPLRSKRIKQDDFLRQGIAFLKAVAPIARSTKVNLTVENVGRYLNKVQVLKPLMEAVPDDEVGLALDITNMYWFGYPKTRIYELAKTFAPHTRYAHAKNIKYPVDQREKQRTPGWEYKKYAEPVSSGDLDFGRILDCLFEAGFKGNITVEGEYLHKFEVAGKKKVINKDVVFLRQLIAKKNQNVSAKTRPAEL